MPRLRFLILRPEAAGISRDEAGHSNLIPQEPVQSRGVGI